MSVASLKLREWIDKNRGNIFMYSGIVLAVLIVYHLLSDGDFSFLMVRFPHSGP